MGLYLLSRKTRAVRHRRQAKEVLEELKSGPCSDCGHAFHPCQMDLVRPGGGGPQMADLLVGDLETLREEASRRELVCSNCGRLRTWERSRRRSRAA